MANASGLALFVTKAPAFLARWTPNFIGLRPGYHFIQTNTRTLTGFYAGAFTFGGITYASLFGNLFTLSDYAVNPYNEWMNPGLQGILDQQVQERCESDDEWTWFGWFVDEALGCPWLR